MSVLGAIRRALGRDPAGTIRVRVFMRGRIGDGWYDVDRTLALPAGATVATLIDAAERQGIRLRDAIAASPHLLHTIMLNGERCPVDEHMDHPLADGDEVYLFAPLAGG